MRDMTVVIGTLALVILSTGCGGGPERRSLISGNSCVNGSPCMCDDGANGTSVCDVGTRAFIQCMCDRRTGSRTGSAPSTPNGTVPLVNQPPGTTGAAGVQSPPATAPAGSSAPVATAGTTAAAAGASVSAGGATAAPNGAAGCGASGAGAGGAVCSTAAGAGGATASAGSGT